LVEFFGGDFDDERINGLVNKSTGKEMHKLCHSTGFSRPHVDFSLITLFF